MPSTTVTRVSQVAEQLQFDALAGIRDGLVLQTVDAVGDDGTVVIGGRRLANFGSCSYLGLWGRDELKKAAIAAIEAFGVSFSSSRLYASLPYYEELESRLMQIFGARVIVTATTTLGHLSALPAIVGGNDAIVIDRQAHSSLQMATQVLAARNVGIHPVRHADLEALEATVEALSAAHDRIWYVADGLYSMFGDIGPTSQVLDMLDRHPQMFAYIDDAHGFAWSGRHGRGVALGDRAVHPKMVLAVSLSKAFGAVGGAVVAGDDAIADHITFRGGPLMFGGPIQTADLAAGVAAADLLLSPEHDELRQRIDRQITFVAERARVHRVAMTSWAQTPIWFVETGEYDLARRVARQLVEGGFWVNVSGYPVVPFGRAGVRFTNTLCQSDDQIDQMLHTLGTAVRDSRVPEVVLDLAFSEGAG